MAAQTKAGRSRKWVTKTDLIRYVRCPYAFWLLDRGDITFEDTVDEFQVRLLTEGLEFQKIVEAAAVRVDVSPPEIPTLLSQEITLLNVPAFENKKLRIYGQPDGIDAARGALFPIEVKSHKDVQRTDELELAFYWLVLDAYRTRNVREPRGYLILRRAGGAERVEVPIRPHRFEEVFRLLQEIRDARHRGVRERICGCNVCSRVKRDDVYRATRERKDLTLIFGIGGAYAPALEDMGVNSWEDLLTCDPQAVVASMRERNYFISCAEIERWKRHAEAWKACKAVIFGDGRALDESFIALDLEYTAGLVWLLGACVVLGDNREHVALWADGTREEKRNLQQFADLLSAYPSLPVLTWSGEGADLPNIRHAANRARLRGSLDSLFERHLDLFLHVRRGLRLPIPSLSLKQVAEYFGISRISGVRDGLEAEWMYQRYRRTRDKTRKATLREQLLEYNRDDIEALVGTVEKMRELIP